MWKGFKDFALKSSIFDLAVAFVLGVAFASVVNSFVSDILMPPIGLLLGGVDFSSLFVALNGARYPSLAAARAAGAPVIAYGLFLNTLITFLIVAFALYLLMRAVNRMRHVAAPPKNCPYCYRSIPGEATRCPECTSELQTSPGMKAA